LEDFVYYSGFWIEYNLRKMKERRERNERREEEVLTLQDGHCRRKELAKIVDTLTCFFHSFTAR